MKNINKFTFFTVLITASVILTGCECKHKKWKEATCIEPRICSECGKTEGEPLGHTWEDATCTEPRTCKVCGETEGEPAGHKWKNADCDHPKTCTVCNETTGEKRQHSWEEANCKTPKKCKYCGKTEGEKTDNHKWVDASCKSPKKCSVCNKTEGKALPHTWKDATCTEGKKCSGCGKTEGEPLGHDYDKKTGKCKRCGQDDPDYFSPSNIKDLDELAEYLNKNFSKIETPFGTINETFNIERPMQKSLVSQYPYDFYVQASATFYISDTKIDTGNGFAFLPYDLDNINVTDEQVEETTAAMMDFQRDVADFVTAAFPDSKIAGGFYSFLSSGWYGSGNNIHYSSGSIDRYFTWCNFDYPEENSFNSYSRNQIDSHDKTFITDFHWVKKEDSDWLGYSGRYS